MPFRHVPLVLLLPLILCTGLINYSYAGSSAEVDSIAASTQTVAPEVNAEPLTAQQMLQNIRQAADAGRFVDSGFYRVENLQDFFGEPYVIKPLTIPKDLNILVISLDNPPAVDGSAQTILPLFNSGKIYLTQMNREQIAAHLVIAVNVSDKPADRLDAAMVKRVFGEPSSLTVTTAAVEKNADDANNAKPISQPAGYWLNYQTESRNVFKNILFKINLNEAVTEIQIYTGVKQ